MSWTFVSTAAIAAASSNAPALAYKPLDWTTAASGRITRALYDGCRLQLIRIFESQVHPIQVAQSAAMASVAPPKPVYRPHLPANLIVENSLFDAQLESIIFAGEAHSEYLAESWMADAIRPRRGWFPGDGTGAGKAGQVAGILIDNSLKGRCRALWVSKSEKPIEYAQRDCSAFGQDRLLITPLSRFRQGMPITLEQGVPFTTDAMLRSDAREKRVSRIRQIADWLGCDFDGVIVFDESHAMQNAAGGKSERGDQAPSQQGRAGLRLQHALSDGLTVLGALIERCLLVRIVERPAA